MNNIKEFNKKNIREYHESFLSTMQIPSWIPKINCPQCNEVIGLSSLREIGLKLNAQHITNFFISVCCQYCNYGYELHIENKCQNIQKFIDFLKCQDIKDNVIAGHKIDPVKNNLLNIVMKK